MNSHRVEIGCQLYTLRELTKTDMAGTLEVVADMGYRFVEVIDAGNLTYPQLKDTLARLKLTAVGQHALFPAQLDRLEEIIADAKLLGCQYLINSWVHPDHRNAEGYRKLAAIFHDVGRRARDAGLVFCHHHHDFEFERLDGQYALDFLLAAADPQLVQLQVDTYWVAKGGENPAAYIRKYAGCVPLVHLKDMTPDEKRGWCEVGTGALDWKDIFAACETAGVRFAMVEQDTCPANPLDSVRLSLLNLKKMGRV